MKVIQIQSDYNLAEGGITSEGTPTIAVAPGTSPTEEFIVHELSHIELILEGYPKLDLNGLPSLHAFIQSDVLDTIQHRIFYPRLIKGGFRPAADRVSETRGIMARGDYSHLLSIPDLAARYFRVLMETNDEALGREMSQWYTARGWFRARDLAEEAFEGEQMRVNWTPLDEVQACLDCGNILLRDYCRLTLDHFYKEFYGKVSQSFALIDEVSAS